MVNKKRLVLAIDASLSSTGYAIMDYNKNPILVNKIITSPKKTEQDRMSKIVNELVSLAIIYNIKEVIIEDQFFKINRKTIMQLSRLRGALSYAFNEKDIEVCFLAPTVIKKLFCGKGNATKEEVYFEIIKKLGTCSIVKRIGPFSDRAGAKKTSDIYDAISIGYAYVLYKNEETK